MEWNKERVSTLIVVSITSFMGTFLISSINIALPAIEKDFGLHAVMLSWVVTSFLLATAIFLLPVGKLADTVGVFKLFKLGILIFTISSIMCAITPSGFGLIIFRFIQGAGSAFTSTTGSAILVSSFPMKYRGRVIGFAVSSTYLGLAFGPFFGGIITQYVGWRALFWISTALGSFIIFLSFSIFKNGEDKISNGNSGRLKIDSVGVALYMLGLLGLVYGSSKIPQPIGWILMSSGITLLIIFWFWEKFQTDPIFDSKMFTKNRLFAFSNIAALINYSATYAIVFLLSLFLQKTFRFSPREAGSILLAQPIVMAIFSPIAGRFSDKIQPRYLATTGMAICSSGLLFFSFISSDTAIWKIVITLIWMGLGFALFSSPNMNTIMSSVPKTQLGIASGTSSTMRVFGQIVSMTVATLFFTIFFGDNSLDQISNESFLKVIKWGFLTFALIGTAGIYFSFARGDKEMINHSESSAK
ncbi:MFS transporter [bacterium]|nr:MFS transporter [bacterium]